MSNRILRALRRYDEGKSTIEHVCNDTFRGIKDSQMITKLFLDYARNNLIPTEGLSYPLTTQQIAQIEHSMGPNSLFDFANHCHPQTEDDVETK